MILIADSGSTKCDWAHLSNEGVIKKFQSTGLNPSVQTEEHMRSVLSQIDDFAGLHEGVKEVYIYSSGCATHSHKHLLKNLLQEQFKSAEIIRAENDLFGAARACLGNEEGLVAILGTGSNAAYFTGDKLIHNTPALGFCLGDEGGGSNIGKALIKKYLYNKFPEELKREFQAVFPYTKDEVIYKVYKEERPNAFLASVMPFVVSHREDSLVAGIIQESICAFIDNHLSSYSDHREVHFVGSVAVYLKEELESCLQNKGFGLGNIVHQPIDLIIDYHKNTVLKQ